MSKQEHSIQIPIGDWSDDGHGICKIINITSNYPVEDLQNAYKASCKLTGVQFNHNENYTGLEELDGYDSDRHICTEYQDNSISSTVLEIFQEFGCKDEYLLEEGYFDGEEHFVETILWFIGLSMPEDWNWKMVKKSRENYLNGFWNDNLNVQFGYGLFE